MKRNRVWIEIVILGTAIACALALLLASLGAAAGAAEGAASVRRLPSSSDQTYEGMVTCSRCGAKHPATLARSATTCIRTCVHGGARFALVDADSTYVLDGDSTVLTKLAGQRAHVTGTRDGRTIRVFSVTAGT